MDKPYIVVSFYDRKLGRAYGYNTLEDAIKAYGKMSDIGCAYRSHYVKLINRDGVILAEKEYHY